MISRNASSNLRCREKGYVLLGILVLMALGLAITAGMLQLASGNLSTRKVTDSNTKNFYDVERTINAAASWLQTNSKNIVTAFNSTNFNNNFDLGSPSAGVNEGTAFAVPTLIKMKGTNNAVQLTNSSYFGTSAFPNTTNIDTNAAFNAVTEFQNADLGVGVNVRLLVVWALQTDGHYQPIFRIDAVTGGAQPEHGVHGINFIKSALVTGSTGVGYYASLGDFKTANPNNECWSYQYTWNPAGAGSWSRGAPRSNCLILGQDDITIKSSIHGSVLTNKTGGITVDHGAISGTMCQGPGCVTYSLPVHPDWETRCSSVPAVDVAAAALTTVSSGDTLASQCKRDITIGSNKTVHFDTPNKPYYIRNLVPQNNSNSKISFKTVGPGNKYILYIDNLANGQINGNQLFATNLAPNQLEIFLTKDGSLTLNGTAAMNAVITARENFTINYLGNMSFYGALRAGAVNVTGNAVMGYDEALGGSPALTDINFTLYKASQRSR